MRIARITVAESGIVERVKARIQPSARVDDGLIDPPAGTVAERKLREAEAALRGTTATVTSLEQQRAGLVTAREAAQAISGGRR